MTVLNPLEISAAGGAAGGVNGASRGRQRTIVAIGDSITTTLYNSHYEQGCMLAAGQLRNVANLAVGGTQTKVIAASLANALKYGPGIIYSMPGRNNEGYAPLVASHALYYPRIAQQVADSGSWHIMAIVPPKRDATDYANWQANAAVIRSEYTRLKALGANVVLIDYSIPMSNQTTGVALNAAEWFDNVHPGPLGANKMAAYMVQRLTEEGWLLPAGQFYRPITEADPANLVPNGTFETDATGSRPNNSPATNWINSYSNTATVFSILSDPNRIGNSLRIETPALANGAYVECAPINFKPYIGRRLAFSAKIKAVNFMATGGSWVVDQHIGDRYMNPTGDVKLDGDTIQLYSEFVVSDAIANNLRIRVQTSNNTHASLSTYLELSEFMIQDIDPAPTVGRIPRFIRKASLTANGTLSVPSGCRISSIDIVAKNANAITGGLNIGTSSGGADVVSALAVPGNGTNGGRVLVPDAAILKRLLNQDPLGGANTIHLQAASAWNSASIDVIVVLDQIISS